MSLSAGLPNDLASLWRPTWTVRVGDDAVKVGITGSKKTNVSLTPNNLLMLMDQRPITKVTVSWAKRAFDLDLLPSAAVQMAMSAEL